MTTSPVMPQKVFIVEKKLVYKVEKNTWSNII
jgi:hypothetical protein